MKYGSAYRRSESGFSLIESLVIIGITSVMMLGIMSLLSSNWSVMAQQTSKLGQTILAQDIRAEIANVDRCTKTLALPTGQYRPQPNGQARIRVVFTNGEEIEEGKMLTTYNLRLNSLVFVRSEAPRDLGAGRLAHFGSLEMKVAGGSDYAFEFKPMQLGKLELITDASGKIESCGGVADSAAAFCTMLGGTLEGTKCKIMNPGCVPRTGTWTWCGKSCDDYAGTNQNGELWTLINQVGSPQSGAGCPNTSNLITCRYRITCPNGAFF